MNNYNYKNKIINKISNSLKYDDICNIIVMLIFCFIILIILTFNIKKRKDNIIIKNNKNIIKKKLNYILNSSINELKKKNS